MTLTLYDPLFSYVFKDSVKLFFRAASLVSYALYQHLRERGFRAVNGDNVSFISVIFDPFFMGRSGSRPRLEA